MDNFFISPFISLNHYLLIQKNRKNIIFNKEERKLISNINKLFNYDKLLSEKDINILQNIGNKLNINLKISSQNIYDILVNNNKFIYEYLIELGYNQIINPYKVNKIGLCIGLNDIGATARIGNFKNLDDEKKNEYIDEKLKEIISNKDITHEIMSKSNIISKINILNRIISNKSNLYKILNNEEFIPYSVSFEINDDIDEIINIFKLKSNKYFVIKPSNGTLSDGVGIFDIKYLNINFIKGWINNPKNNKYALDNQNFDYPTKNYISWILSDFIESFLWKINKLYTPTLIPEPFIDKKLNFIPDKKGRINSFRFFGLFSILNNEFTSYLYEDAYVEISSLELNNYNLNELDPTDTDSMYYSTYFNEKYSSKKFKEVQENKKIDKIQEAIFVGTFIDFAKIVNENNFPLGKEKWNSVVIPGLYNILNTLTKKTKKYFSCMNEIKKGKGCFSYFALDIIIDKNGKPFLLEINSRPFIGFADWFDKYDPQRISTINVNTFLRSIIDIVLEKPNKNTEKWLITNQISKFRKKSNSKMFIPFSLGLKNTSTAKIYSNMYDLLIKKKYKLFPYAKFINKSIGFTGLTSLSKYLISKINELGDDKFEEIMKKIYPKHAKQMLLNKISNLGYYLGDKTILTDIINKKAFNEKIIPFSITIKKYEVYKIDEIFSKKDIYKKLIIKPSEGQQGKGIYISNSLDELKKIILISEYESYVISEYLDNPYLIKLNKTSTESGIIYNDKIGRKNHIRSYVLAIKKGNKIKIYLYSSSLIFCAVKEYGTCNNEDSNYCNLSNLYWASIYYNNVLKIDPDLAYKDLCGDYNNLIKQKDKKNILDQIKNIIRVVLTITKNELKCLNNTYCYQQIAFDFMINQEISELGILSPKVYLLEVNATPGLKAPSYEWSKNLGGIENYFDSIFNITLDTKLEKGNNQLFKYLPNKRKILY